MFNDQYYPSLYGESSDMTDPKLSIPPELFTYLFYSLPPSPIATSSVICKSWRTSILSDPVIDSQVDLTTFDRQFDDPDHDERGWVDFGFKKIDTLSERERETPRFDQLLSILLKSKDTLREISLEIDPEGGKIDYEDEFVMLDKLIFKRSKSFKCLKKVDINAPSYFSSEIREESTKSLIFSNNEDISERDDCEFDDVGPALDLMEKAKDFIGVGSGFIEFSFPTIGELEEK